MLIFFPELASHRAQPITLASMFQRIKHKGINSRAFSPPLEQSYNKWHYYLRKRLDLGSSCSRKPDSHYSCNTTETLIAWSNLHCILSFIAWECCFQNIRNLGNYDEGTNTDLIRSSVRVLAFFNWPPGNYFFLIPSCCLYLILQNVQ